MHQPNCERTPWPLDTTDDESECRAVAGVGDRSHQKREDLKKDFFSVWFE